jgi:hypothetical protein
MAYISSPIQQQSVLSSIERFCTYPWCLNFLKTDNPSARFCSIKCKKRQHRLRNKNQTQPPLEQPPPISPSTIKPICYNIPTTVPSYCNSCGSENLIKSGMDYRGFKRYKCRECLHKFTWLGELSKLQSLRLKNVTTVPVENENENPSYKDGNGGIMVYNQFRRKYISCRYRQSDELDYRV